MTVKRGIVVVAVTVLVKLVDRTLVVLQSISTFILDSEAAIRTHVRDVRDIVLVKSLMLKSELQ